MSMLPHSTDYQRQKALKMKEYKSHIKTYVVSISPNDPIKIGRSKDVEKRISALQTSHPSKLKLEIVFDADIESLLHEKFRNKRVCGEWFNVSVNDVLNYAKSIEIEKHVIKNPTNVTSINDEPTEEERKLIRMLCNSRASFRVKTIDEDGYELIWLEDEGRFSDHGRPYFERDIYRINHIRVEYEMIHLIVFGKTEMMLRLLLKVNDYDDLGPSLPSKHFEAMRQLQRANTVYIEDGLDFNNRKEKLTDLFNRKHKQKLIDEIHLLEA